MPNAKRGSGLYLPIHSILQAFAIFLANILARRLGSRIRDGSGVVVSVRRGTQRPCQKHHRHNPAESSGSACRVLSTLDGGRHSGQDLVLVVVGALQ